MTDNEHNRRERRWGQRNIGGLVWGMIFATVVWAVLITVVVLIVRVAD